MRERSARELLAWKPDLLLTQNTPPTASVLHLTRTVPVVFVVVTDPVGSGFVKSLALPGGNATGFTIMEPSMGGKWLELLKEIAPQVRRVAFLFNPATAPYVDVYLNPFKAAAASLGLEGFPAPVHEESEFETIFAAQARTPNSGLVLISDGFLNVHRVKITLLAAHDSSALDTNSGPLSLRTNLGAPRALTRRDNTSMTRPERMRPSTSIAKPSLVNSSATVRHLSC